MAASRVSYADPAELESGLNQMDKVSTVMGKSSLAENSIIFAQTKKVSRHGTAIL
jgi:hypothetical protein